MCVHVSAGYRKEEKGLGADLFDGKLWAHPLKHNTNACEHCA